MGWSKALWEKYTRKTKICMRSNVSFWLKDYYSEWFLSSFLYREINLFTFLKLNGQRPTCFWSSSTLFKSLHQFLPLTIQFLENHFLSLGLQIGFSNFYHLLIRIQNYFTELHKKQNNFINTKKICGRWQFLSFFS